MDEEWSKTTTKKGDLRITANSRGISLCVIVSKVYNEMLLQRIRPHIEPILLMNQNGFRPKHSTLAHILTLKESNRKTCRLSLHL